MSGEEAILGPGLLVPRRGKLWISASVTGWRQLAFVRWLPRIFAGGVILYLAWRLQRIGLAEIWAKRPQSAVFYLLMLASYLVLPLADTLIYARLWKVAFWRSLPAFLRKRIYNAAFIGYSGELFLLMWARRRVSSDDRALAHTIKDTNILSAVVSTLVSAGVILYVLVRLPPETFRIGHWTYWAAATLAMAAAIPFALMFRQKFMLFGMGTIVAVSSVHLSRFVTTQLLQVAMWKIQLPGVPLNVLATLLAVQMLVSRIPLLPNRDILFVGIGIGLAGPLALPPASLASVLVTVSLFQQVMHLAVFVATSFQRHRIP